MSSQVGPYPPLLSPPFLSARVRDIVIERVGPYRLDGRFGLFLSPPPLFFSFSSSLRDFLYNEHVIWRL